VDRERAPSSATIVSTMFGTIIEFLQGPMTASLIAGSAFILMTLPARAADERVFEMRTYHCHPGRLDALHGRFRDHTNTLFVKHGISLIAYWTPLEGPAAENTLVYVIAYPSMAAREASWKAFREDPAWVAAKDASEVDGPIVEKVDSLFLSPTDYSPIH
jgi:hypothetical protein